MSIALVSLSLVLTVGLSHYCDAQISSHAKVNLIVESLTGDRVEDAQITMILVGTDRDLGAAFKNTRSATIPFGQYALTVWAPGFKKYERRIWILGPAQSIRIALKVSGESAGLERFQGVVKHLPQSPRKRWVVLYPLAGSPEEMLEVPLREDGTFAVECDAGSYLLAVMDGDKALASRPVYVIHNPPLLRIILESQ